MVLASFERFGTEKHTQKAKKCLIINKSGVMISL